MEGWEPSGVARRTTYYSRTAQHAKGYHIQPHAVLHTNIQSHTSDCQCFDAKQMTRGITVMQQSRYANAAAAESKLTLTAT